MRYFNPKKAIRSFSTFHITISPFMSAEIPDGCDDVGEIVVGSFVSLGFRSLLLNGEKMLLRS